MPKTKISSDSLENVDSSQFEGSEYESDWFHFQAKFTLILGNFELIE